MYTQAHALTDLVWPGPSVLQRLAAWWSLDDHMPVVDRAYNKVRCELEEVGLLADGVYLDSVELEVSMMPSLGETGYVYDEGVGLLRKLAGFRQGVIYLPGDIPGGAHLPPGTLLNTIRHEYAHAWYAHDPGLFARPWFRQAFGLEYDECKTTPEHMWKARLKRNRKYQKLRSACRSKRERKALKARRFSNDFVSDYAATLAKEDFAESFATYLRYRNSLGRFAGRPGIKKKLMAVEQAVQMARKSNRL